MLIFLHEEWADNTDPYLNFNAPYPVQYINDGSCYKYGCTADWAENFDPIATDDDESCFLNACMSEWADNYNSNATSDDGSCFKEGCMLDYMDNYDDLLLMIVLTINMVVC